MHNPSNDRNDDAFPANRTGASLPRAAFAKSDVSTTRLAVILLVPVALMVCLLLGAALTHKPSEGDAATAQLQQVAP